MRNRTHPVPPRINSERPESPHRHSLLHEEYGRIGSKIKQGLAPAAAPTLLESDRGPGLRKQRVLESPPSTVKAKPCPTAPWHRWPGPPPALWPPQNFQQHFQTLTCSVTLSSLFSPHWRANTTRAVLLLKNNKMFYTHFCIYN